MVNGATVSEQLESISSSDFFEEDSAKLVENWRDAGVGLEAVDSILAFMENNPEIDYGPPGPLVHFIEQFHGKGYERHLVESVTRTPTPHTVWMLNRVINGTKMADVREPLVVVLEGVRENPAAKGDARAVAEEFLSRLAKKKEQS